MKKILIVVMGLIAGCGSIEEGNVGVRTTFTGKVLDEELAQGFYTAVTSSVDQYSAREITVKLFDMKPKAADNLSLADLDLEVYYRPDSSKVADLKVKYANRDAWENGVGYPAYQLVQSYARNATYNEIAKYSSLEIHRNREQIASAIETALQSTLDASDPNTFQITKVIVRSAVTDPAIEESIKVAVARQKELEAKKIELDIAKKQVEINHALDESLTPAVLAQRRLDVQMAAIEKGVLTQMILGDAVPTLDLSKSQ